MQLYLVLQKKWFEEILSGNKKEEYRDFTDFYINRLCETDKKTGEITAIKPYTSVKFQEGYNKDARQMVVECKGVMIEADEGVTEYDAENCNFVIELGEILEKNF